MKRNTFFVLSSTLGSTLLAQGGQNPAPAETPPGLKITSPGIKSLKIGGEYRLRYEGKFDYDLDSGSGSAASNDYFTQRVRLDFDAELSDRLRVFAQIQDAREWGEEASTTDDSADGLDLHQGYLNVHDTPLLGGDTRAGRQEINLGDQRLIGSLDWATGARSFDGLLQSWSMGDGKLHAFALQAREVINADNDDARVFGLYQTGKIGERATADFYLLHLQDDGLTVGSTQQRGTVGTRWIVTPSDPLEFGLEAATQFGEQSGADIPIGDTYAVHVHGQYALGGAWKPKVTAALDMASGDDPNTADNERFNNLFPTAHAHWGMMDLALWENLFSPWARLAVSPDEDSTLSLTWLHLAAMEAGDAFRGPAATLSNGNPAFSKTMGEEFDLFYNRVLHAGEGLRTSVQFGYGLFLPGTGAEQAQGSDDPAHFVYMQFDVRF